MQSSKNLSREDIKTACEMLIIQLCQGMPIQEQEDNLAEMFIGYVSQEDISLNQDVVVQYQNLRYFFKNLRTLESNFLTQNQQHT